MNTINKNSMHLYQATVIFSVLFTLVGFSYNVWRMEASEKNNNIRTACFEMLLELSSLEQLVYAAHYDGDTKEGNPRKGWVKVGLISDLSILTTSNVKNAANTLNKIWSDNWSTMTEEKPSVDQIIIAIDSVRKAIKTNLSTLE